MASDPRTSIAALTVAALKLSYPNRVAAGTQLERWTDGFADLLARAVSDEPLAEIDRTRRSIIPAVR